MATVSSIASAIATVVDGVTGVDYASSTDYMPGVQTQSIAALVVPMSQASSGDIHMTLAGGKVEMVHRLPVEFWVKHAQGSASTTMQRAANIGTLAIAALLASDGSGYSLAPGSTFEETIDNTFIEVGGQPYLVATLIVPVRNEVGT